MNRAALVGACLLSVWPVDSHAQQGEVVAPIELSFSRAAGRAGETVKVPMYLKSELNVVAPFRVTLQFRRSLLTYRGFEPAYLARYAGWTMKADLQKRKPDDPMDTLEIVVDPADATSFPSGVVAYIEFVIGKDAANGEIPIAAALLLPASSQLVARAEKATVTVYTELTITGCFFYMH